MKEKKKKGRNRKERKEDKLNNMELFRDVITNKILSRHML